MEKHNMHTIYLSGPMTGLPNLNFLAFLTGEQA